MGDAFLVSIVSRFEKKNATLLDGDGFLWNVLDYDFTAPFSVVESWGSLRGSGDHARNLVGYHFEGWRLFYCWCCRVFDELFVGNIDCFLVKEERL